jgi:methionyl-tRNA formyltransferase
LFPKVFRVPKLGTVNVHGEVLPEFRGGSSVIWPIYEGIRETGLTVHRMDERIDTGEILHRERFPIAFKNSLRETVEHNVAEIARRIPVALVHVITHFDELVENQAPQGIGRNYTTPTFRQYRRILRQHKRLSSSF